MAGITDPWRLSTTPELSSRLSYAEKWDTDDWGPAAEPLVGSLVKPGVIPYRGKPGVFVSSADWTSVGGMWRGCGNTVVFQSVVNPSLTFTITTSGVGQQSGTSVGVHALLWRFLRPARAGLTSPESLPYQELEM